MLDTLLEDTTPVVTDKTNGTIVVLDPLCLWLDLVPFDLCSLCIYVCDVYTAQKSNFYKNSPEIRKIMAICKANHSSECIILGSSLSCCIEVCNVELFWN